MTDTDQLRSRLSALRDTLTTGWGAHVSDIDLDALPDDVIAGLCDHEAHRIRALIEGTAAGWTPAWRSARPAPTTPAPPAAPSPDAPPDSGGPVVVRFHRAIQGRVVA